MSLHEETVIHRVGPHEAIIYSAEEVTATRIDIDDEEFFQHSLEEVKVTGGG